MSEEQDKSVMHLLTENRKFPPDKSFESRTLRQLDQYESLYKQSLQDPEHFWLEQSTTLAWFKSPSYACRYTWDTQNSQVEHTWFEDGQMNVSYNCLDRHLSLRKTKPAIIWQGDQEEDVATLTFEELHYNVMRFSNVLKSKGVEKGDRVCIYSPMIPELVIAMLGAARIGAIHSVVFGGFSAESLSHRINDCNAKLVMTANVSIRGGKKVFLKEIVDRALEDCPSVETVIVAKRNSDPTSMTENRDVWWMDEMAKAETKCEAVALNAEDPLFILYTSGSTGKPKGVVHTQAGYLLHTSLTHKYVFDIGEDDIYWCTADIGWITGHSYLVYGPLANGTTTLLFEGVPHYPDPGRFWHIIDKFKVNIFYTAPTVIRSLIRHGQKWPKKYQLTTLRVLGTVGEPINPETWMWYREVIGKGKCPIVDTWWQTETGGIMIAPLPSCHTLKPGSALRPFFGIDPVILREDGSIAKVNEGGCLCMRRPWPGMMRTLWNAHDRFISIYFSKFDDLYFTGDGCRKDEEGDYWLLGRIDDVVNISGHRLGTAEVESALVSHPACVEAAVVAYPHPVKGQGLFAFVLLVDTVKAEKTLKIELAEHVKKEIGAIATPDYIQFAKALPKTRSGKIMRRILKRIAMKDTSSLGDISTLADPKIIQDLISPD